MMSRSRNEPRKMQNFSSTNDKLKKEPSCFECKKPGHLKADCPNLKQKATKRRAMVATQSDDKDNISNQEEEKKENLRFMANISEVYDSHHETPRNKLLDMISDLHDALKRERANDGHLSLDLNSHNLIIVIIET